MKATPEQIQAVQIQDRALAVSAGAGTGKTWTLTQRFLHLLAQHPDWPVESIVAVTFTEKAAREMRVRLANSVAKLRREEKASGSPTDGWQRRWQALERLQVSTVHSLCARILRENAIAAGIDPLFNVLDEQQADLLKDEAVRQALAELAEADDPALDLLAALQVRDLRRELERLLRQRGTVKRLFEVMPDAAGLEERWRAGITEAQQGLWLEQRRANPLVAEALLDIPRVLMPDAEDKLAGFVELAQSGCQKLQAGDLPGALRDWLGIKVNVGSAVNWGGKDALLALKDLLKSLREAAKALDANLLAGFGAPDVQAAQALQHWRAIWQRLEDVYTRLKDEQQALDFDDLEMLTLILLREQRDEPRLREYLAGIHHLMVDEFQDTNHVQQEIVYALAHPSDGGRLFVVGDAKQSIYRFRQAQVSVFNQTLAEIELHAKQPAIPLSTSFRAQPALLRALNDLFDKVLRPLGEDYADYEARPGPLTAARAELPHRPQAPAPVELWLLPAKDADEENVPAEDGRIYEAQIIARRLLALHSESCPVWDKERSAYRPFRFGDAAVLFRATTSLPLYEAQFKALGLPYLTVSGRGYYDRPEVRDLIALLAALYNARDDLNLAAALRSPLFGLSDETLYRLRWHDAAGQRTAEPAPYAAALADPPPNDQQQVVRAAAQILSELWGMSGRVDAWRLLRRALDLTAYEATLALLDSGQASGGRPQGNVQKLLELARAQRSANLSDFLRSLQDLRAREAREGEALGAEPESGAVQLMSIHAAKGLEFPVVFLADIGREKRGGAAARILHDPEFGIVCQSRNEDGEWVDPASYAWAKWLDGKLEEAETRRLLYVACTRAADLLVLSGKPGKGETWLEAVQNGWQISGDAAEEIVVRPGYTLRVLRPAYDPQDAIGREGATAPSSPGCSSMPSLALPLNLPVGERHTAVTRLKQALYAAETEPELELYPAVRRPRTPDGPPRAPHYKIGRLVHRALADWNCLELPDLALAARLHAYARREAIATPAAREHAVGRAIHMLQSLRRTALYAEIRTAVTRQAELPFVLDTPVGVLHGQIDLLYQDGDGGWKLLDWKTDWVALDDLAEHAREQHLLQLAAYAQAVARVLGQMPQAAVCFLAQGARLHTFSAAELEEAWRDVESG